MVGLLFPMFSVDSFIFPRHFGWRCLSMQHTRKKGGFLLSSLLLN